MSVRLHRDDLPALACAARLQGSGGGGSPRLMELLLPRAVEWPIDVVDVAEADPQTPCCAVAFAGSTMVLTERFVDRDPFVRLIHAAERWLGTSIPAVCAMEGGGINALVPLLCEELMVVDADLSGRAVPSLDQMSIFVDELPGLITVCETGGGGLAVLETDRPADIEALVRASMVRSGGAGVVLLAGFTVGDLADHAITGHTARGLALGRAFLESAEATAAEAADAIGARLIGLGRVAAIDHDRDDPHLSAFDIRTAQGEVLRVVARSEFLAVILDGAPVATSPDAIIAIDVLSHAILEVADLTVNAHVAVLVVEAAPWWWDRAGRAEAVLPSAYGLTGVDVRA